MYDNILVPVSLSEDRDLNTAFEVAQRLGGGKAQITLLNVVEQLPPHTLSYLPADHMAKRRAEVEAQLAKMTDEVPHATGAVASGHAGRAILDYAQTHGIDCIVIASHRPGMQHFLLGSTAARVVRHAKCAVHVIR
ncbi:universal stress protein [Roseovarius spongiae]|uniref:Universal stress protein n=1 Tax=Roseovarius spongiae TaxID=2320272 RepID=A0A3A8AV55_9RHOB|nr:universal stress protein [Roseovarius spongiae]RKF14937.1 universal stress protein [Roseovarius spongiae]